MLTEWEDLPDSAIHSDAVSPSTLLTLRRRGAVLYRGVLGPSGAQPGLLVEGSIITNAGPQ